MSGLYFGHKLRKRGIHNFCIVEKERRVGGRSQTTQFVDAKIQQGTGIGVAHRDSTLLSLLNELNISYSSFTTGEEKGECISILAKLYEKMGTLDKYKSFLDYAQETLTDRELSLLVNEGGYTDYLDANALTTLYYYGLEDNYNKYVGIGIDWNLLTQKLASDSICITSCEVFSIIENESIHEIVSSKGNLRCKNVVIASTISTIRKLTRNRIYDVISSHPFMRIYASFRGKYRERINKHITRFQRTYNKLHFISRFSENVFMIAYTDGEDALSLFDEIDNVNGKEERGKEKILEKYLFEVVGETVKIDEMKIYFWSEATHKYTRGNPDFNLLRNPKKNMYVVGEAVASIQGWTEGALRSVDSVFK